MTRKRSGLLALVLTVVLSGLLLAIPPREVAHAALGSSDFLKASGTVLKNNSGTGSIVTLRGTNLGGWLSMEQWMSPLGEGNLSRSGWTATGSGSSGYNNALDGNLSTSWTDGTNQTANSNWFKLDMGGQKTFDHLSIDAGTFIGDSPVSLLIQVSSDGTNWTTVNVIKDSGTAQELRLTLDNVYTARYLLLIQTGSKASWWSIAELNVAQADDYSMRTALYNRFGVSATDTLLDGYQNTWITTADLDHIRDMGMNMVRVPISWQELVNSDGTWKAGAFTQLDWVVSEASARNMYVLLDLHVLPGGNCPWASCGQAGQNPNGFWTNTANQDLAVSIWQGIATHFNGNPAVAGYDLMNEPLLSYNETSTEITTKSNVYDRLYDAVRAIDPDHTIFLGAFFGFDKIAAPSTYGWTNVVYEIHPYDMPNSKDWNAQNTLIMNALSQLGQYQEQWNVPVYAGEYSFYFFYDLWSKWMSGLNALNASWTNWTYKVTGTVSEGGGANWGFYNTNTNPVPDINKETTTSIASKWSQFGTGNFLANSNLINTVTKFAGGQQWMATIPLDQTGWTASASVSGSGTPASNALDWNIGTRWSTGANQANGQWFQVNMGSSKVFDEISIETDATNTNDYPAGYLVQVSNNGSTWTTVASGAGFGHKMVIPFATQYAQYIRVTQTGTSTTNWWNIAEFHAFSEPALNRTGWTATASSTEPGGATAGALDGNAGTRWSNGAAQANGQWYQVDMGQNQTFDRVLIDAGASASDYPRGYQVQVSTDGTSWTTVKSGTGSGASIVAEFPVQVARYMKIIQTGSSTSWWSISELNVYGELAKSRTGWSASASSTEPGGSTANALDGNAGTRWSGGVGQASGQWFQIDLGSSQWFNHIVMDSGSSTGDYARKYIIQVSSNGTSWTTIANAEGSGQVVTANFPITEARYVKITLKGSSGSWWSISEIRLFE
ncbi:discoidin domain-containing protein [Cohnella silvisoli]|uniref:Discoidin domain-containing protein n=1 Tax=Cohnella silvisoli TaxID=2873699 RepID=A0ABV1KY48_9BACL|nr:discoidin domain-containing protein [Cohnella silvisoli]MCD9023869.1 discoidin domain-containing protein [Cohnella silvisoli]